VLDARFFHRNTMKTAPDKLNQEVCFWRKRQLQTINVLHGHFFHRVAMKTVSVKRY
jgi:hypothetical protein